MHTARGGSSYHYRDAQSGFLQGLGHLNHLVEARCDKARQTHHVGLVVYHGLHNLFGRNHHPEVDNFVVVARHHHRDDVLA